MWWKILQNTILHRQKEEREIAWQFSPYCKRVLTRASVPWGHRSCSSSFVFLSHPLPKYYIQNQPYIYYLLFKKSALKGKESGKLSLSPCTPFPSPFASFSEEHNFLPGAITLRILPEMNTSSKSIQISSQRSARCDTFTMNVLHVLPSSTAKLCKDGTCHATQQPLRTCWMTMEGGTGQPSGVESLPLVVFNLHL